jgi:phage terminase small subunit
MAEKKRQPTATQIRESLETQLKDKGADVLHFQALLDDYIFFYKQLRKMQTDIRKNGATIKAVSAAGKKYDRENPAIKQAALYNNQMLQILREMGLTTGSCRPPNDDGGDLG